MGHDITAYPTEGRPAWPKGIAAFMRRCEGDAWNKLIYKVLDKETHWTISSGDGTSAQFKKEQLEAALDRLNKIKAVGSGAAEITKERNFINDCIHYMNEHKLKTLYIDFS